MPDETVTQRLEFDASQALEALKQVNEAADTTAGKANLLNQKLQDYSRTLGQSWKQTLAQFKELAGSAGSQFTGFQTPLGKDVTADVFKQTEALAQRSQAMNKYITEDTRAQASELNFNGSVKLANSAIGEQSQQLQLVTAQLVKMQAEGRLNLVGNNQAQINQLKSVISEVSQATGAQYRQVADGLESMGVPAAQASAAVKGLNHELVVGTEEAKGFRASIDIVRTALGTLVALGVFQFLQMLQTAISDTVKNLRDLEGALYNIRNAERILSQQGVSITPKDLQQTINTLQAIDPMLSKVDATKAVSSIALFTKELGFNKKQIDDLSQDITVLAVRNKNLGLSFEQVRSQVLTGLLTGRSQGIRDLGVSISDDAIKAEALRLKLVDTKKAYDDLAGDAETKVKAAATLSILSKSTEQEKKDLESYFNTVDGQIGKVQAAWQNFLTTLGADLAPAIVEYLKGLVIQLQHMNDWLVKNQGVIRQTIVVISGLIAGGNELGKIKGEGFLSRLDAKKNFERFIQAVKNGMDEAKAYTDDFGKALDTPTSAVENFGSAIENIDTTKAQNALQDMLKSLQDLQKKMADAESDFQTKLTRFDEDGARERGQIVEDYNLNVLQTQRQFAQRKKDANDKYRQKEKDDERKFQEQMRQLQENFLYDLEDALRERDAKQVLRLTDKYNMEKQNMINENALRKKSADEQHKQDLEQMKKDEAERLLEMAEEEAVRLKRFDEEQAIKRKRMEEDHAIEMQRMKEQQDEIIRQAADKIAQEYDINAQGADALYQLLSKYYGNNGALAKLTSMGYNAMLQQAGGFLSQMASVIAQYQAMMAGSASMFSGFNYSQGMGTTGLGTYVGGLAKGGQFVATKPTTATFGESGNELVTITPLSQLSSMQNKQPLNGINGLDGRNGQTKISVQVDLSKDLEARVIQRSQDGVADVVNRINRTKE